MLQTATKYVFSFISPSFLRRFFSFRSSPSKHFSTGAFGQIFSTFLRTFSAFSKRPVCIKSRASSDGYSKIDANFSVIFPWEKKMQGLLRTKLKYLENTIFVFSAWWMNLLFDILDPDKKVLIWCFNQIHVFTFLSLCRFLTNPALEPAVFPRNFLFLQWRLEWDFALRQLLAKRQLSEYLFSRFNPPELSLICPACSSVSWSRCSSFRTSKTGRLGRPLVTEPGRKNNI